MKKISLLFVISLIATASAETDGAKLTPEQMAAQFATEVPKPRPGVKTRGGMMPNDERVRVGTLSGEIYGKTRSAIALAQTRAIGTSAGTPIVRLETSAAKPLELQCPVSAATEIAIRLQFNFNSESFADPATAGRDLDSLASALKTFVNPQGITANERIREQFLIEGHTCDVGDDVPNQILSGKRALAVRDQLLTRGVPDEMLLVLGQGEKRPAAPNDSELNRALNRRVVVAKVNGAATAAK